MKDPKERITEVIQMGVGYENTSPITPNSKVNIPEIDKVTVDMISLGVLTGLVSSEMRMRVYNISESMMRNLLNDDASWRVKQVVKYKNDTVAHLVYESNFGKNSEYENIEIVAKTKNLVKVKSNKV